MPAVNATTARSELYRLIDRVNEESEAITITGRRSAAVLVSESDWEDIMETIHLVSIPGFSDSLRRATDENDWSEDPGW